MFEGWSSGRAVSSLDLQGEGGMGISNAMLADSAGSKQGDQGTIRPYLRHRFRYGISMGALGGVGA